MTPMSFQELRELLDQYELELEGDGLACSICGKVLVDARIAPCACRYCRACIRGVLERGGSTCPGGGDDCRVRQLTEAGALAVDHLANRSVRAALVACPEPQCAHRGPLRLLQEHLRVCEHKLRPCPFRELGCDTASVASSRMTAHLAAHQEQHGRLVVSLINNLTNEIRRLQESHRRELDDLRLHLHTETDCLRATGGPASEEGRLALETVQTVQAELAHLRSENGELQAQLRAHQAELRLARLGQAHEMGVLVWHIDNLSEKRSRRFVSSNYIYTTNGDKLVLQFFPSGLRPLSEDVHSSLKLCMSKFQCNQTSSFHGRVVIDIYNQRTGLVSHTMEKDCDLPNGHSILISDILHSQLLAHDDSQCDSLLLKCTLLPNK